MRRNEIERKFDEIVAFAEMDKFIDTTVKHYSSGMYVRLGFAVAAHLETEIILIDEVLAVGDAEFQKKCLAKMKQVTTDGRTVVFVSHNMMTVTDLCTQCVLLNKGGVQAVDNPRAIADIYFSSGRNQATGSLSFAPDAERPGDDVARLCSARIHDSGFRSVDDIDRGEEIGVELTFEVRKAGYRLMPNFHVFLQDQYAFVSSPPQNSVAAPGIYRSTLWIPRNFLNDGVYVVGVALTSLDPTHVHFYLPDALRLHVSEEKSQNFLMGIPGVVRPTLHWDLAGETRELSQAT
jgi:lipopolysaccharide transport system ATP-binding protein